jgi:hypothetical protein
MVYKVLVVFFVVVVMQLIYFLLKSTKDRAINGNIRFKGKEYVRGYILLVLFGLLLFFMLF